MSPDALDLLFYQQFLLRLLVFHHAQVPQQALRDFVLKYVDVVVDLGLQTNLLERALPLDHCLGLPLPLNSVLLEHLHFLVVDLASLFEVRVVRLV